MNDIENETFRNLIESIEREEARKEEIAEGIRDIYARAKAAGFDTKIMRQVVRLRKMDAKKRAEEEAIRDLYLHALGELSDLPLGKSAMERAGVIPEQDDEAIPRVRKSVSAEAYDEETGEIREEKDNGFAPSGGFVAGADTPGLTKMRADIQSGVDGALDSIRQMMAGAG